ncbi:PA2778 family cysteine peptidase [uncultured Amphritea sp.]|uniref:PA2778 family cysteine peptidase n=1 Tax=uncultured Amphritea sp. TaxID=981605 RepID=UPI0026138F15|nr:PA2778 family cysteine peptidase [uncultured Amphritea sp.]
MVILLLVTGCSSNQRLINTLTTDPAISGATEISDLAYFPQQDDQCGPAALATMLDYNHIVTTPEQLRPYLYIPGKGGTLAIELEASARQYNLLVYPLKPDLSDILRELDAGHPVLVMQNLGFNWFPQWHFAVAIGYDLSAQQIYLRSGPDKRYPADLSLFEKTWSRADHWARVILPPDRLPATATLQRYIEAANKLEQLGIQNEELMSAAAQAYQTALEQWPDSSAALMGLGNIRYAQQRYDSASDYFIRYIEKDPAAAAGWNNLAYSLMKTGCTPAAMESINCAVSIEPDLPIYRDSRNEISNSIAESVSTKHCSLPTCIVPKQQKN